MPIGRDEVERAARLARLELDEATAARLVAELSRIVDYVDLLEEAVGDAGELALSPPDAVRDDLPGATLEQSVALGNAARTRAGAFEVPGFLPDASQDEDASP
ncbi:MAG: hypothetical protein GF405_07955 [Candidatus Eisenbacteria bacterium]|nr:hypothetical protein [Candidatus Eisenbacteria bacterium]